LYINLFCLLLEGESEKKEGERDLIIEK